MKRLCLTLKTILLKRLQRTTILNLIDLNEKAVCSSKPSVRANQASFMNKKINKEIINPFMTEADII